MAESVAPPPGMSSHEIETMRAVEDELWWYRALRGRVLDSIDPPHPQFKLLDAGCGSGGMLARVRERFPDAVLTGLDFSRRALELTQQRKLGVELIQGSTDTLPFGAAAFDLILSLDVLIVGGVNAEAALHEFHRVLRPGGKVIVNVPAFDFLRGSHDAAVNIARRYTRSALKNLLREAGFEIQHLNYWNTLLLPAVAAVRWASRGKAQRPQVASDLSPMWPPLNTMLSQLLRLEFALGRSIRMPFGTSLFAVARK